MKHKAIYVFVAVLMAFSLLLSACGGGGGQASNFPDVKELKFDEPMVVSSDCGEGDYVKEIAALDEMTVQFTMCKPDPTFLAKAAFTPFAVQPREWIEQQGGETRQILELPIGTVTSRLSRARRLLRVMLDGEAAEDAADNGVRL